MSKEEISGVESDKKDKNIIISSKNSGNIVPFYKDETYILDNINFVKFIKNVESQVRTSKDYKAYIYYLKNVLDPPLNRCMVYSNIDDSMANIEMHHFLFTLFDYVEIIIGWYLKQGKLFSSSRIFSIVMEEHRKHHIPVMMLSEAVHKAIHNDHKNNSSTFLDYRSAHGDIVSFLEKYYSGLSYSHIAKLKKYFEKYKEYSENPPEDFFETVITKWTDEIMV